MTYSYRDAEGDRLQIEAIRKDGEAFLSVDAFERNGAWTTVHIAVEDVEELIAGIREQARQASS
jgi:hypothetical protein